jgi:hypothetical protein
MPYCPHLRSKVDIENPSGNTLIGIPRALMMEIQVREIGRVLVKLLPDFTTLFFYLMIVK